MGENFLERKKKHVCDRKFANWIEFLKRDMEREDFLLYI